MTGIRERQRVYRERGEEVLRKEDKLAGAEGRLKKNTKMEMNDSLKVHYH